MGTVEERETKVRHKPGDPLAVELDPALDDTQLHRFVRQIRICVSRASARFVVLALSARSWATRAGPLVIREQRAQLRQARILELGPGIEERQEGPDDTLTAGLF
jgi:hypothetical protein